MSQTNPETGDAVCDDSTFAQTVDAVPMRPILAFDEHCEPLFVGGTLDEPAGVAQQASADGPGLAGEPAGVPSPDQPLLPLSGGEAWMELPPAALTTWNSGGTTAQESRLPPPPAGLEDLPSLGDVTPQGGGGESLDSAPEVTDLHLLYDTGASNSDAITVDPTVTGTLTGYEGPFAFVEFDKNSDGQPDGQISPGTNGQFSWTPTALPTGEVTIRARGMAIGAGGPEYGEWVATTFTKYNLPIPLSDALTTVIDTEAVKTVTQNDDFGGAPSVTVQIVSQPSHGSASLDGNQIRYTPEEGYLGSDSLTYKIDNLAAVSGPATVSITVSPVSVNLSNGLPEETENTQPGQIIPEGDFGSLGLSVAAPNPVDAEGLQVKLSISSGSDVIKLWKDESRTEDYSNRTWNWGVDPIPGGVVVEGLGAGFAQVKLQFVNGQGNVLAEDEVQMTVVAIESVEFGATDGKLSGDNPGWAGGGKRFFPDKQFVGDTLDRNTIVVKAKVTPVLENITVSFRAYDIDDPSRNQYIDPNDGDYVGASWIFLDDWGDDNRGTAGAAWQGNATVDGVTDAQGYATVTFETSYNPGDNYRIGAGFPTTVFPSTAREEGGVKLSESLTVWRKLYLEKDVMFTPEGDTFTGIITRIEEGAGGQHVVYVQTPMPPADSTFENGILRIDVLAFSFAVESNIIGVDPNGQPIVLLFADLGGQDPALLIGHAATVYDDDWQNNAFGLPKVKVDTTQDSGLYDWMQASTSVASNRFAEAYIEPDYGALYGFRDNLPPATHVASGNTAVVTVASRGSRQFEADEFWIAYVATAFQGGLIASNDPNGVDNAISGRTSGSLQASLVFLETIRDLGHSQWIPLVAAHEVGHQIVGPDHDNTEPNLMHEKVPDAVVHPYFLPKHISAMRSRIASPGMPQLP